MPNQAPTINNFDAVFADDGTFAFSLAISAPTDADNDPLTVTVIQVPDYGTVQYFDGVSLVTIPQGSGPIVLTGAELESLQYTPDGTGEHGGGSLVYTVSDGVDTVTGTIAINDVAEEEGGPPALLFSATGTGMQGPDLFLVDANGNVIPAPLRTDAGFPYGSHAGEDGGYTHFAGNLYFFADVTQGGNVATDTLVALDQFGAFTPVSGLTGVNQENAHFTEFDGSLYFRAITTDGDQLAKLDADGTLHSIVLNPGGQEAFAGANGGFTIFDGSLYFSAVTAATNGFGPDLIKLDADGTQTEISTRLPANAAFGSYAGEDGGFFVFNNALYFNATSDTFGDTLFRLDAGSTTPVVVDPTLSDLAVTQATGSAFHIFDGNLYFNEFSNTFGDNTLLKLDTSGNLTALDYNGEGLEGAGALGGFADMAGSTYFVAQTSSTGVALFKLDADGIVTDVYDDNLSGAFDVNIPANFVLFDGSLYFDAYSSTGDSLFKLDREGTLTTIDLGGGGTTLAGVQGGFTEYAGSLYFSAYTADGNELVKLDADGTFSTFDINSGAGNNSNPGQDGGFGVFPQTTLNGTNGNDILVGCTDNDTLNAGPGNDLLIGRDLNDRLTGGDGADVFQFSAAGSANVDTITDYTFVQGDSIDVSALLDPSFVPGTSNVSDFIRLIPDGVDLKLQVDTDGPANGASWSDVAILQGANTPDFDEAIVQYGGVGQNLVEANAYNLHTAALSGGGWAMTWTQSTDEDGTIYDNVFARVYDAASNQLGGTIQISDPHNDMDDYNSILTALPNNEFAVTWQSCADEINTQVFDANGNAVQVGATSVTAAALGPELNQVINLANGGYAVLWQEPNANLDDTVYVSTFDANGGLASGPIAVDVPSAGVQNELVNGSFSALDIGDHSSIVQLQDGFAVMWVSLRDEGSGNFHPNVYVRAFQPDGTPLSGEIQVNGVDGALLDLPNEIVALGGNDFAVQWESDDFAGGETVFTRIFQQSNTYTGSTPVEADTPPAPNTTVDEPQQLLALSNGGYVALWGQYDVNDFNSSVYVQVYDHNGNIATGSQPGGIQVDTAIATDLPDQVISLAGGGFAVMWEQVSGGVQDTFIRTFNADGSAVSGPQQINPAGVVDGGGLEMVALADGSFATLYSTVETTANGSRMDYFLQHVDADGTILGAPVEVGSTPSDLSNATETSFGVELRTSAGSGQRLFIGSIDSDSIHGNDFFDQLAVHFTQVLTVNHAPSGANNAVTTNEDTPYHFGAADFGFSDPNDSPANTLLAVEITTLPTQGTLTDNGNIVHAGDFVGASDIAGGLLVFTPQPNGNGATYATFTFQVQDNGGTAGGGSDTDPTPNTLTVNVTAVNDPPVAQNDNFATLETTAIGAGLSVFNNNGQGADTDPDNPLAVSTVNGGAANVGHAIALASGALVTVNANGTFTYDPNHAFDLLPAAGSGATNLTATDTFTYTDSDGSLSSGTATVTVTVSGVDSNDLLQGSFAAGTTLAGGIGNDTYVVHNTATAINDASGTLDVAYVEGVSYSFAASATGIEAMIVEHGTGITGTGYAAAANTLFSQSAVGEAITLVGGSAADYLSGGLGTDSLQGGGGDDSYVVHATATTISDTGGSADIAYVEGVNFALANGDGVDYAILENGTGHTLTGHTAESSTLYSLDTAGQSNTLVGGSAADFLAGSLGTDHLQGGDGSDVYVVYSAGTTITDTGGAADVIYAENLNYALTDGDGIENLILEGTGHTATGHATQTSTIYSTGTGNTLVGGSAQDILTAGAHGDILIGNGGNDFLLGGAGNDTFQFDTNFGQDVVYNFHPHDGGGNQDTIRLTGEAPGTTFASMVTANLIFEAPDASQASGTDVVVEHDANNYVVLLDHHLADLSASDFLFA